MLSTDQTRGGPAGAVIGRAVLLRLGVAFALGCGASLAAFRLAVPGDGAFVVLAWLAGFVAILVAPGWRGLLAVVSGAAVSAAAVDLSDGSFTLIFVVVAAVAGISGHGALVGTTVRRVRTLGPRQSLTDTGVLAGTALAVGTLGVFIWLALELASGPI